MGLTLDEWTAPGNRQYLNINLHFSKDIKYCLELVRIKDSTTSNNIFCAIKNRLFLYEIDFYISVFYLTTDGASVMTSLGKISGVIHVK